MRHSTRTIAYAGIVLLAALGAPQAAIAQQADGERLFRQRCGTCHSVEPGQSKSGPPLDKVIGRDAGSIEGARYSNALRDADIVWDDATLDTFLAAPRRMIPGTTMTVGVTDPAQRAAIIAYLQSL